MMVLLPPEAIPLSDPLLEEIDRDVKSIYRLIIFSGRYDASQLLARYQEAVEHLREVLSVKNAQQEAQSIEEAREYVGHLRECLKMIIAEIGEGHTLGTPVELLRLFRHIAPEAVHHHPNGYRRTLVQFGRCFGAAPEQIEGLVHQLFDILPTISHPALRAAYLHHELVRIHPFVDGNGRVSRMAKNWLLMYELYPPIFIYGGEARDQYIAGLDASFLALQENPTVCGDATRVFFHNELRRIKASAGFILSRMLKSPGLRFGSEDFDATPYAAD